MGDATRWKTIGAEPHTVYATPARRWAGDRYEDAPASGWRRRRTSPGIDTGRCGRATGKTFSKTFTSLDSDNVR